MKARKLINRDTSVKFLFLEGMSLWRCTPKTLYYWNKVKWNKHQLISFDNLKAMGWKPINRAEADKIYPDAFTHEKFL
jgi:hypothetical protein